VRPLVSLNSTQRQMNMLTAAALLTLLAQVGCAGLDPKAASTLKTTALTESANPAVSEDSLPRLVIPAFGGAPIVAIPLGGGLFLPVTGGPPIIGVSTSP